MSKQRLDKYLVETSQIENRSKVKNLIRQNLIRVNNQNVTKPGYLIDPSQDTITIKPHTNYVSRSAFKLEGALNQLKLNIEGKSCADIGASTGGFTQVLLQHNPEIVYAIDVGHSQLHPDVSGDPRVKNIEKTNAKSDLPIPEVDLMVADLSFISAHKYTLNLFKYINQDGALLLLFKPQFEVGKENLKPNGVVKSQKPVQQAIQDFESFLHKNKLFLRRIIQTQLTGKKGNQEYFFLITR